MPVMIPGLRNASNSTKLAVLGIIALLWFTLYLLARTSWISDDAMITLRSVLNFIHGYGPNFNIDERVQSYTHPLWFLLLSAGAWLSGSLYIPLFVLSFIFTLICIALLPFTRIGPLGRGVLLTFPLLLSKAFIDFSTSGLEGPLTHLLIILAVLSAIKAHESGKIGDVQNFLLIAGLTYLSRPDIPLLLAPLALSFLLASRHSLPEKAKALLIASLPVVLWSGFSLFYYGFPFPNTAYAKLYSGIPLGERMEQGFAYMQDSLQNDPISLWLVATALLAALLRPAPLNRLLALGSFLYVLYIVSIGGDFMSGRLFTPVVVMACIIHARTPLARTKMLIVFSLGLLLSIINIRSTLMTDSNYTDGKIPPTGIANERVYYYPLSGLFSNYGQSFATPAWKMTPKKFSAQCGGLGLSGFHSGPGLHVIDTCGLADPLLARIPAYTRKKWRIGHFFRYLPNGYFDSVESGQNLIKDPVTHAYYNVVRHVTRGPLLSVDRMKDILRLNLALVEKPDPAKFDFQKSPEPTNLPQVPYDHLSSVVSANDLSISPQTVDISKEGGLDILFATPQTITSLNIVCDGGDYYALYYPDQGRYKVAIEFTPDDYDWVNKRHHVVLPSPIGPVNSLRLMILDGDGNYRVAHVEINPKN